jgi:hypothetical protein
MAIGMMGEIEILFQEIENVYKFFQSEDRIP